MLAQRRLRNQYTIIGRQMNGREVPGYYLELQETGERKGYILERLQHILLVEGR